MVNQHAVRGLFWAGLLTSVVFAQAGSSRESTDPQTAYLIARVKDVLASKAGEGVAPGQIRRLGAGKRWTGLGHYFGL